MKKDGKLPDKTKYSNSTMTLVSYRVQRWQIAKILNFKFKLKINISINKLYSIKKKQSLWSVVCLSVVCKVCLS